MFYITLLSWEQASPETNDFYFREQNKNSPCNVTDLSLKLQIVQGNISYVTLQFVLNCRK